MSVEISRCAGAHGRGHPGVSGARPAAAADREVVVSGGVVAEVATVRRFAEGEPAPVEVASIEVDGGGTLIARLAGRRSSRARAPDRRLAGAPARVRGDTPPAE